MAYLQLMVEIMAEHGINVDALLKGTGIEPAQANQPDARMAAWQWGLIVYNAMELSDCRSLGYEYGLRMQLSVHGFLGYATMTSLSGEDAIKLLARYFRSRQRNLQLSWSIEGDACVINLEELHPLGPVRAFMFEALLIGIARGTATLVGTHDLSGFELAFDWEEPAYHQAYRDRLPPTRFGQPRNALRYPARFLQMSPQLADAMASQQAIERCEQELALAGGAHAELAASVRGALTGLSGPYPTQQAVAKQLHLSSRSLARKLRAEGTSFAQLAREARKRDAVRMLEHSDLKVEDIATRLGYLNPATSPVPFATGWAKHQASTGNASAAARAHAHN